MALIAKLLYGNSQGDFSDERNIPNPRKGEGTVQSPQMGMNIPAKHQDLRVQVQTARQTGKEPGCLAQDLTLEKAKGTAIGVQIGCSRLRGAGAEGGHNHRWGRRKAAALHRLCVERVWRLQG